MAGRRRPGRGRPADQGACAWRQRPASERAEPAPALVHGLLLRAARRHRRARLRHRRSLAGGHDGRPGLRADPRLPRQGCARRHRSAARARGADRVARRDAGGWARRYRARARARLGHRRHGRAGAAVVPLLAAAAGRCPHVLDPARRGGGDVRDGRGWVGLARRGDPPGELMLRAAGLVKSYRAPSGMPIRVLAGVDLTVKGGEIVVVAGPSGSGKSTLLNVLGLLEDGDGGEVWFEDTRVSALGRSARSQARGRYVGFLFQSFLLLPSLTALENVLLAARYVGRSGAAMRRRARELLAEVGVADRMDHFPAQLSGGEQQRVAFCRAVLNDPPLLLADEPTGNLDDANGAVILGALRGRARAGAAVVVVSHRPEAAAGASALYRLRGGVVESS